jgi:hypothetical protein
MHAENVRKREKRVSNYETSKVDKRVGERNMEWMAVKA